MTSAESFTQSDESRFSGHEDAAYTRLEMAETSRGERKKREREQKKAEREAKQAEEEASEVDRILQKIADEGMNSLTGRERKILDSASARKRQNG